MIHVHTADMNKSRISTAGARIYKGLAGGVIFTTGVVAAVQAGQPIAPGPIPCVMRDECRLSGEAMPVPYVDTRTMEFTATAAVEVIDHLSDR